MRGWRRLGWLAVATVLVAPGCWLQSGYDARRSAANTAESTITAANVAGLERAWEVPGGGQPVVSGGTAYLTTATEVHAVAVATGAARWAVPDAEAGDLAVAGGRLWVARGDAGCSLRALDTVTGEAVVTQAFGGNPLNLGSAGRSYCGTGQVLASGGTVTTTWSYFAGVLSRGSCFPNFTYQSGSGTITLDAATGAVVAETGGVGTPGCAPPPAPGVDTLSSDGAVTYMPTGSSITRFGTCGGAPCGALPVPEGTSVVAPVVPAAGGRLVLTSADGRVLVLDRATGAVQWSGQFASATSSPPAVTATTIHVAGADGAIAAFPLAGCGAATCDPSWTATSSSGEASNGPVVGGDVVYVAEGAGASVSAFAAAGCGAPTCEPVARVSLGQASYPNPVVAQGTLFVRDGGTLAAYRLP